MLLCQDTTQKEQLEQELYSTVLAHCKSAAHAESVCALAGRLHLSSSGWLILSVPNAVVKGLFDALEEQGVELPLKDGKLNAHISVMSPEEVAQVGGAEKISERGHAFKYTLGAIKTVKPAGLKNMAKVWFCAVKSPELQTLRKSYGLSPLPKEGKQEFHIVFAVRKTGVLQHNETKKAASFILADKVISEESVKAAEVESKLLKRKKKRKKDVAHFPLGGILGAGAATGAGLGAFATGSLAKKYGDLKFEDVQSYLDRMRHGASFNKAWRPWNSEDFLTGDNSSPYLPTLDDDAQKKNLERFNKEKAKYEAQLKSDNPYERELGSKNIAESQAKLRSGPGGLYDYRQNINKVTPDRIQSFPKGKISDYNWPDFSNVDKAVKDTLQSPDLLSSQLSYADMGSSLLSKPTYGKYNALDMMGWFRQPENRWWWNKVLGGSYWGDNVKRDPAVGSLAGISAIGGGKAQGLDMRKPLPPDVGQPWSDFHHYNEFAKGFGSGYRHMQAEDPGRISAGINTYARARQETLQDIILKRGPFQDPNAKNNPEVVNNYMRDKFISLAVPKEDFISNTFRDTLGTGKEKTPAEEGSTTGILTSVLANAQKSPFIKKKVEREFDAVHDLVERANKKVDSDLVFNRAVSPNWLPEESPYSRVHRDNSKSLSTDWQNETDSNKVQDQGALIRRNMQLDKSDKDLAAALMQRASNALAGKEKLPNQEQKKILYEALKDDPTARFSSVGAYTTGLPYIVGSPAYTGLAKTFALPGQAAYYANKVSPYLRYGGLGLAGLGAGYGAYRLFDWLRNRKRKRNNSRSTVELADDIANELID